MWYVRIARLLRGNDDVSTAGMLRAMEERSRVVISRVMFVGGKPTANRRRPDQLFDSCECLCRRRDDVQEWVAIHSGKTWCCWRDESVPR
jgi:hypothetical protein